MNDYHPNIKINDIENVKTYADKPLMLEFNNIVAIGKPYTITNARFAPTYKLIIKDPIVISKPYNQNTLKPEEYATSNIEPGELTIYLPQQQDFVRTLTKEELNFYKKTITLKKFIQHTK